MPDFEGLTVDEMVDEMNRRLPSRQVPVGAVQPDRPPEAQQQSHQLRTLDEPENWAMFLFVEKVAMLLGCIRNYKYAGHQVDLDGVLRLEPELAEMLVGVREQFPRAF